jgi:hypothetical protein
LRSAGRKKRDKDKEAHPHASVGSLFPGERQARLLSATTLVPPDPAGGVCYPRAVAPKSPAMRLAVGVAALWALCIGCADSPTTLPPLGEALLIVDTDAPVPLLVSRLRVDAFTTAGVWYATNDFALPDPSDWPASFGAYSPDPNEGKSVVLRLRAYADGNTRDYRGERFLPRPSGANPSELTPLPPPPPGNEPRLVSGGIDITPSSEPQPLLAIDRLILVEVVPGKVNSVRILLHGDCFGTMADLGERTTCIDTENVRVKLAPATLDTDLGVPSRSLEGSFGAPTSCTAALRPPGTAKDGTPLYDEEVCVPGGAFIFGTDTTADFGIGAASPERVAVLPPIRMDRYEVTVAHWRDALTRGFVPPATMTPVPYENPEPFPKNPAPADIQSPAFCTYSASPMGREDYPVNCLVWYVALAFCVFEGGSLPTESQWEYAASMSGRHYKTAFAWGGPDDATPVCAQAVFGRGFDEESLASDLGACTGGGYGPLQESTAIYEPGHVPPGVVGLGDSSVGLGIANLGASMSEFIFDTAYSLASNCWMSQALRLPVCVDPNNLETQNKSMRGAGWDAPQNYNFVGFRYYAPNGELSTTSGLRCVRSGTEE